MKIGQILAVVAGLVCAGAAWADTRVEVLGRVTFNGFSFGYCGGDQPCPLVNVRVGEFAYMTFIVDDTAHPSSPWPPCPGHPTFTPTENGFNLIDGSFFVRMSDAALAAPVSTLAGGDTSPNMTINWQNCTVDRLDLNGGALGRGGQCCYPNGSCTYVKQSDCAEGTWTFGAPCTPANNPCAQPTGVCCDFDNTCTITTQVNCASTLWSYGGACTPGVSCPQDVAACCSSSGSCAMTTQTNCAEFWNFGFTCSPTDCPRPAFHPDYGVLQMIAGGPTGFFTSAETSLNRRTYPSSVFDPNYQLWQLVYSYIDATGPHEYDLDVPIQIMVMSDATTPTGSCCPGDGHCLVCTQAICPMAASWSSGGACTAATCPAGSGACCFADGTCQLQSQAACAASANSVYKLDGSACGVGVCPLTGGCCANGVCTVVIETACQAVGGSWIGVATTCGIQAQHGSNLAANVGGRCCHGDGTCNLAFQSACSGGSWTAGGTCDVACPNAGACCDSTTGACVIEVQAACIGSNWSAFDTCATLCPGTGACCNPISGSCAVVYQSACTGGSTWSVDGTCAAACPGAGACCNTTNGYCYMLAQAQCQSGSTWNPASTCSTPCSTAGISLPDAASHSAPSDAPKSDAPGAFTNTIAVTDAATIQSLTVSMNISMSRVNDLRVMLIGPNGATVNLMTRIGAKPPLCTVTPVGAGYTMLGSYFFTDSAPQSFYDYISSIPTGSTAPGSYKPAGCGGAPESLNATFAGMSSAGTWTLAIQDERAGTRATLYSWGISFNGGSPTPCAIGHCVNGASCTSSTFALCTGTWSIGPCVPAGSCPSGTPGACCFLDSCSVMCASACPSVGVFRGSGTVCTPASVCQVACCTSSGGCVVSTPADCGGTAGAPGSACNPNTCPQPVACCLSSGACLTKFAAACTGTAGGPGSTCNPNICPHGTSPDNDICTIVAAMSQGSPYDVALDGDGLWSYAGALDGATSDGVVVPCSAGLPTADLWWRFRPTTTGSYLISMCSSPTPVWDSTVSVWSDCTTQVPGACADDGGLTGLSPAGTGSCSGAPGSNSNSNGHGSLTVTLSANTNYFIRVATFSPATTVATFPIKLAVDAWGACCGTTGSCTLRVRSSCNGSNVFQGPTTACSPTICSGQPVGPDNDACATVLSSGPDVVLSGGAWSSFDVTMAGATADGVVPSCAYLTSPDVWWRFVPTVTGTYLIRTCNSPTPWDTTVSVWNSCTTQVPGACGDDSCGTLYGHGSTTTTLTAGNPYLIRVGLYSASTANTGTYRLDVNVAGACCNGVACTVGLQSDCTGTYRGDGTSCSPSNPCSTGVCCRGATCGMTSSAACTVASGTAGSLFVGPGSCGVSGTTPCCYANYNKVNGVSVQDIFDFLSDWFAGSPYARVGGNGTPGPLAVQDIFNFLSAWFAGGC